MATTFNAATAESGEGSIRLLLASYQGSGQTERRSLNEAEVRRLSYDLERIGQVSWSRVPRIYAVLRLLDHVQLIDSFIEMGISDIWFPFSSQTLPDCMRSPSARARFLELQEIVLTKAFDLERDDGRHRHFSTEDDVPMRKVAILGKGGFGFVDHVVSTITHREYARKLLPRGKTFKKNTQVLTDFERELGHLKKLRHIHIVELIGSYTDPKYVGILMSPVAECDLKSFLDLNPLPIGRRSFLRTFFGCLATAVRYLHDSSVRHKDIKPQNILVKSDKVFLTDFGISTDWSELGQSTTSGPTIRTPRYCAPEVAKFLPRNTSSDLWSLGCVFLEIWTVLKGETVASLNTYLQTHGTNSTFYYSNHGASIAWCRDLEMQKKGSDDENPPVQWILGMLQLDPSERWSAQVLCHHVDEANESENRLTFSGLCCITDDDHVNSISSSKRSSLRFEETGISDIAVYCPQPQVDTAGNGRANASVAREAIARKPVPALMSFRPAAETDNQISSQTMLAQGSARGNASADGRCCCLCTHCRTGIQLRQAHRRCLYCDLNLCDTCFQQGKHPSSHDPWICELRCLPKSADLSHLERETCAACKELQQMEYKCSDCLDILCALCAAYNKSLLVQHDHRRWTRLRGPRGFFQPAEVSRQPCCCDAQVISICTNCLIGKTKKSGHATSIN